MAAKGKFGLLIVLALIMAGVSILLINLMISGEKAKAANEARITAMEEARAQFESENAELLKGRVEIVVASHHIEPATVLFPEMLQTKLFPADVVPEGAVTKIEDAVEKVALYPLPTGDILMNSKIKTKSELSRPSFLVEKGMRYITLSLDPAVQGVAAMIRIGDVVDILATYGDDPEMAVSKIIVQKAKVVDVAYGDKDSGKEDNQPVEPGMPEKRLGIGDTVTFEVSPDDAEMLKALDSSGISYKYLLRNYQDDETVETPGRRTADVISGLFGIEKAAPVEEAPLPPAPNVF